MVDGLWVLVAEVAFVVRMKPVAFPPVCGLVPLPDGEPQEDPKRRLGLPDPSTSGDRVRR